MSGPKVQVEAQVGQQGPEQNKSLRSCCCSCSKGKRRLPGRQGKVYRSWQKDSRNLQLDLGLLMRKGLESLMPSKVVMKKFRRNGSLGVTSLRRGFAANGLQVNKLLDYARRKCDDPVTDVDLLNHTLRDIDAIDAHLHVALVSLTQEMAYDVVYNSRKKCGLDAWR